MNAIDHYFKNTYRNRLVELKAVILKEACSLTKEEFEISLSNHLKKFQATTRANVEFMKTAVGPQHDKYLEFTSIEFLVAYITSKKEYP